MSDSAYLLLRLHGIEDSTAAMEFLLVDRDVDGVWVRTSLATGVFKAEVTWFLASINQREFASIYRGLAYGKDFPAFAIHDTDCSFSASFSPSRTVRRIDVAVEIRCCYEGVGPAVALELKHACADAADVQALMDNLSRF